MNTPIMPVTPQPTLEIVRRLQAAPKTHVMLEIDGGWCIYLPSRCQTVWALEWPSDKGLEAVFNEKRIDSIVVSPPLLAYTRVASDPYFQLLLNDPHRYGWETIQLSSEYYFQFSTPR
jgi:hypothetical protein